MKKIKKEKAAIQIGKEYLEIGPDSVPKTQGKPKEEIMRLLRKAVKEGVFSPI